MLGAIVTLDIETTGLDPKRDRIIEIGAVRSENGVETAVFQSFVNPGIPIPSFITDLTGIRDELVADAPTESEVITAFTDFVGESPVLAHNARFDLAFLRAGGMLQPNLVLDTIELATILMPMAPRYGLGALAEHLGIELIHAHRALEDARATSELYWKLWQRACALPEDVLKELCQNGEGIHWPAVNVFLAALEANRTDFYDESQVQRGIKPIAHKNTDFSYDPSIINTLTDCLRTRDHVLLESGAIHNVVESSLFAAIEWIHDHGEPVVLATRDEDSLALLRLRTKQLAEERNISWSELASPSDFLCKSAWLAMRSFPPLDVDEIQFRARVLVWLAQGGNGNRRQLRLRGSIEKSLWRRISGEQRRCENEGECFWCKNQHQTKSSQLILTTVSDWWLRLNDQKGPHPFQGPMILFEVTQIEDALTEVETIRLDQNCIVRTLRTISDPRVGLIDKLLKCGVSEKFSQILVSSLRTVRLQAGELFDRFEKLSEGTDSNWLSLDLNYRTQSKFQQVLTETRQFCDQGDEVVAALDRLSKGLAEKQNISEIVVFMRGLRDEFYEVLQSLQRGIVNNQGNVLCWLERNNWTSKIQINCAPIRPGRLLSTHLLQRDAAVILQDNAISIGDDGQFWQERIPLPGLRWQSIRSKDNDTKNTLVYVPQDIPAPNERSAFQRAMERSLIHIASEHKGRTIALFTSYTHLRESAVRLQPRLDLGEIQVFQGNQIDQFLEAERGLLLVNWKEYQKLCLPVGSCSITALVRLPFDLPNLPLVAVRSSEYENGFNDYSVPIAISRMLRMIRKTQSIAKQASAFVILDSRIVKKRYGELFLGALPNVQLQYGESSSVGTAVQQWLDQGD